MHKPYEQHGNIAVIALHNPPVNGLSHELRTQILAGQRAAEADPGIAAVVLIGAGRVFSGGADIREFNTDKGLAEPTLPTLIEAIESSPKPVIAAIGGVCMGGGLELALACHFRIARTDAMLALPEVKLGLLPGAGGTQRLPRLVPGEMALNLIVSGETVPARHFQNTALLDEVFEGELFETALAFAERVVKEKRPLRRTRDLPLISIAEDVSKLSLKILAELPPQYPAPFRCVEAVCAAFTMPFDEGVKLESQFFQELVAGDVSKALRHAFFGERAASRISDLPESTRLRDIRRVGVIGAGTMGSGIAMNFLNAGIPVTLIEQQQDALDRGVLTIHKNYQSSVRKGKLKPEDCERRMALLTPALRYEALKDADLIIEAVFEDMDVKQRVFQELDRRAKPGAILASNTSTLDINSIAAVTGRPADVLGLHFFSPAHIMKLLEVVRGDQTAPDVLATAMALAKTIKKTAVVSGVCDGFIGNRMIAAYSQQAMDLLEEGATPQQIDQALEKFGMAMGPFRMSDLAGNDIGWAIRKRKLQTVPDPDYPRIADRLCELGRYGQKTGRGWYEYGADRREAQVDPIVDQLIVTYRNEKGIRARSISDEEIVERCILALVNEGARILEEKIAQRASDIDMVYLSGYGFPLYRGGPMFYADCMGLKRVSEKMHSLYERTRDPFWKPAQLLIDLASAGKSFTG
jgi:3-hydroxyacyl-CoA dehydrogenase